MSILREHPVWEVLAGTVLSPARTFGDLDGDAHPARYGTLALLAVSAVYTVILAVFLLRGYPPAATSALGLSVDRQYAAQIWYQVPLFFSSTALTAAALVLIVRLAGRHVAFAVAFGRVSLGTAVPFALTTMLVEAVIAALLAVGALRPLPTLHWLTGSGVWFATLYQSVGLVWLAALVVVAIRVSGIGRWWLSALAAVPLLVLHGLPVGLLIR